MCVRACACVCVSKSSRVEYTDTHAPGLLGEGDAGSIDDQAVFEEDDPSDYTYLPGDKAGYHMSCRHVRTRHGCAHCTHLAAKQGRNRLALGFIEDGAGPQEFWQNVSPKRNIETFRPRRTEGQKHRREPPTSQGVDHVGCKGCAGIPRNPISNKRSVEFMCKSHLEKTSSIEIIY